MLAQAEPFDYVLLGDCVFEEEHIASLVATLAGMASIGPSTTVRVSPHSVALVRCKRRV